MPRPHANAPGPPANAAGQAEYGYTKRCNRRPPIDREPRPHVSRTSARFRLPAHSTASFACKTSSTRNPLVPCSISSGMEPRRIAMTGVPQAIASITERPKGSSKLMRWRRAWALPRASTRAAPRRRCGSSPHPGPPRRDASVPADLTTHGQTFDTAQNPRRSRPSQSVSGLKTLAVLGIRLVG